MYFIVNKDFVWLVDPHLSLKFKLALKKENITLEEFAHRSYDANITEETHKETYNSWYNLKKSLFEKTGLNINLSRFSFSRCHNTNLAKKYNSMKGKNILLDKDLADMNIDLNDEQYFFDTDIPEMDINIEYARFKKRN